MLEVPPRVQRPGRYPIRSSRCGKLGAMPTLVVGMYGNTGKQDMPTTSVGMAPIGNHLPQQELINRLAHVLWCDAMEQNPMKYLAWLLLFVGVLGCGIFGCGKGYPETVEVFGHVTYDGKPISIVKNCECEINFWPESGRPARGEFAPDGSYRLTSFESGDGAVPGEYRVTIKAVKVHFPGGSAPPTEGAAAAADPVAAGRPWLERLIPQRYEGIETSGLTATVEPGKNEINFDLPAE